ncbi:MAG: L,D-transpeptidase family protein [Rhodopseudomonas sp.]|nr:L,D-transpeptidase family protein [Rhodopseudomonas sp.]
MTALIAAVSCGVARAEPVFIEDAAPAPYGVQQPCHVEPYQLQPDQAEPYQDRQVQARPDDDPSVPANQDAQLDPRFQRRIVSFPTHEVPGTIIIDTPNTYLYLVLGNGQALRYGIGVGREGFTWSGVEHVARKAEWPDWRPPAEMIARQPYLPRFTAGGPGNPLGARAMYLGHTEYRIHGTNDPSTIGKDVSSGCIRLTNEDVEDLYNRVQVGAKVVVLPQAPAARPNIVAQTPSQPRQMPAPDRRPLQAQAVTSQAAWAGTSQARLY